MKVKSVYQHEGYGIVWNMRNLILPVQWRLAGRFLYGFILLWLFGAAQGARADQVDDYVTAQMQEQHIPGLSLAVVRNGQVVKARGYGLANVELNVPATAETVYPLASLTKQFTAAAILILAQEGKVGLDDKISRYLQNPPANWRDVTVRHLLSHISGIKDYLNELNVTTKSGASPQEIASAIGELPLNFAPGTQSLYSNTNYLVLGMIVEKVSGKSYDEFLTERVFKPLGMNQTRRHSLDDIIRNRAAGYVRSEDNSLRNSPFFHPTLYDNADAGLMSSVLDMARWDAVLYGDSLLKLTSREQMWSPVKLPDGSNTAFGFGWLVEDVNGHRLIYHNGNRPDCSSYISRYAGDILTVIVLTNLGGANPGRICRQVAGLYAPALMPIDNNLMTDTEPEVTALIKRVLLNMQDGTLDSELFVPERWKEMTPEVAGYVRRMLLSCGPFKSIDLLEREEKGWNRRYRYRAVFRDKNVIVNCVLTKEGKIGEIGIRLE